MEEMLPRGVELIVGKTIDLQFGPVILLGLGGTSVEIYKDTALRLAPLEPKDVLSMVGELKAHPLLEGYRGVSRSTWPSLPDSSCSSPGSSRSWKDG